MTQARPVRLLIVEDDADLRQSYVDALSQDGFAIRATHDGAHAAALLRSEPFDLAVLDIKLPGMSGLQVAAVARASNLNRAVPIYFVSGWVDPEVEERAKGLRGTRCLTKPFEPETLAKLVREHVERGRKPNAQSAYDARVVNAMLTATSEVFEFYCGKDLVRFGSPGMRRAPASRKAGVSSLIGIKGQGFTGSLAITTSREVATIVGRQVMQGSDGPFDDAALADLMAELANQVCGRLKIALASLGIPSLIGLPKSFAGDEHELTHAAAAPVLVVPMTVGKLLCQVELCLQKDESFVVDESKATEASSGVLLFD